jgi:hypothetical protein
MGQPGGFVTNRAMVVQAQQLPHIHFTLPTFSTTSRTGLNTPEMESQPEDTEPKHATGVAPDHPLTLHPVSLPAFDHKSTEHPRPKFSSKSVPELISTLYLMTNVEATDTKSTREAALAVDVFKDGHPAFFEKHSPLLPNMIWFFVAKFDFNVSPQSLHVHDTFESPELAALRTRVVCSLVHQYEDMFVRFIPPAVRKSQIRDANQDILSHAEGVKMIRLGTTVLYWYLNDLYVTQTGIRERKDSWSPRRPLEDFARLEVPCRSIKMTIDYRSRFSLEDYGLSLTILEDAPPIPLALVSPSVQLEQYENSIIGFDDADNDINFSSKTQTRSLFLVPRALSSTKKNKDHDRHQPGNQNSQEKRIETALITPNNISNPSVQPQDQSQNQKRILQIIRQPIEGLVELPPLGEVDHLKILDQVIEMASTKYSERYGAFRQAKLNNPNTDLDPKCKLINSLNPKVILAFQNGIHDVEDLIRISGEPEKRDCPGIYLHILWKSDNVFLLYIGQSIVLMIGIPDHNSIRYRIRHPSMHYTIWDSSDDIKSLFVTLASFDKDSWSESQSQPQGFQGDPKEYMLNLLEMWMCCAF